MGTAIVTAIRTATPPTETATVHARDLRGSADDKRAQLAGWATGPDDNDLDLRTPRQDRGWRLVHDAGGDHPAIDEYFDFMRSGVQPVRDEAVLAFDRDTLEARMRDYFDADLDWDDLVDRHPGFDVERARYNGPRTRRRLLESSGFRASRCVRFLHRPFDVRWLYWETDHKLLNEPRRELVPYWIGLDRTQVALVVPQTRRRKGAARPLAATQVPGNECVDPNARAFPLWSPPDVTGLQEGELGHDPTGEFTSVPNVRSLWIDAARTAGSVGDDADIADRIFHALFGVMASSDWLENQPISDSDLPSVPLPRDPQALEAAAATGRRFAALIDPDRHVDGVTMGSIDDALRGVGNPDTLDGTPVLMHGRVGYEGGRRTGDSLLWNDAHGWRNIPERVWEYSLGGFNPLTKYLSYRVGRPLTAGDREHVMHLVRRLAALDDLATVANDHHETSIADPLEV